MGKHQSRPWVVSDEPWALIEPLLPDPAPKLVEGLPRVPDRLALRGILFVLHTGIQWEYLPQELGFGSGMTCGRPLAAWNEAGVWDRLHAVLLKELRSKNKLDWSRAVIDSTHVRAARSTAVSLAPTWSWTRDPRWPAERLWDGLRRDSKPLVRYGDGMTESLPSDVADVLAAVLNSDDPVHAALRRQVPHLSVRARCTCGCGTAYFALDTSEVEPAPTGRSTVVAAAAQLVTEAGEWPGEVLAFAQDGYLSWLEVCSWSDDLEVTLTSARHWLQPRS